MRQLIGGKPKGFLALSALLFFPVLFELPAQAWQVKKVTMYFLRDEKAGAWCGYLSKDEWMSRAREAVSTMMGHIEQAGSVREVNVRQQDSTADWLVDDTYTLNGAGRITQLKRTIVYFSDDERKETLYRIQDGHAVILHSAAYSLKTRSPLHLPLPMDEYESWKIFTGPEDFPFNNLLKQSAKIPATGGFCIVEPGHY